MKKYMLFASAVLIGAGIFDYLTARAAGWRWGHRRMLFDDSVARKIQLREAEERGFRLGCAAMRAGQEEEQDGESDFHITFPAGYKIGQG